jgi:superfamily II DNA or RNA helicase
MAAWNGPPAPEAFCQPEATGSVAWSVPAEPALTRDITLTPHAAASIALRPRQLEFVERVVRALLEHLNTLGVAPTGSGKTVIAAGVVRVLRQLNATARVAVLAHRDELTAQNLRTCRAVNPDIAISIFDSGSKSWRGPVTFVMVPTLARDSNLATMPVLDLIIIDEAHHAAAATYEKIVAHAKELNPRVMILGLTATPTRGDNRSLRTVFDNAADQISLAELIASGHLVMPRTFIVDVGVEDSLRHVRVTHGEFDMAEVATIMDRRPIVEAVIDHWREKASDRKTIIFCSTIAHATHVADAFCAAGIEAVLIHGKLPNAERRIALARYERGSAQVAVNVAVLTEGWDHQPTSCVVLLRPSSCKSTMIQMIGRGLRTVDPKRHPGLVKNDCIVLDFGTSALDHGTLEQEVDLHQRQRKTRGAASPKPCPACGMLLASMVRECPGCGHVLRTIDEATAPLEPLEEFDLAELEMVKPPRFQWADVTDDGGIAMACGFGGWVAVAAAGGKWHALGGMRGQDPVILASGSRSSCLAAGEEWLGGRAGADGALAERAWHGAPPTEKQLRYLDPSCHGTQDLTRYKASCLITLQFNRNAIEQTLQAAPTGEAA